MPKSTGDVEQMENLKEKSHAALVAMSEFALALKEQNPDTPEQNRKILVEYAIQAWINMGGSH